MRTLLVATLLAGGCYFEDEIVEIRACNDTEHDFDSLVYDGFDAGAVPSGACSDYELAEGDIYRYTRVDLAISGDEFALTPIDFVGETPLTGGRWSYHLTIPDYESRSLAIEAIED